MDSGTIWTVITSVCFPVAAGLLGFFWREIMRLRTDIDKKAEKVSVERIWTEIDRIKEATSEHRVLVAQQYVVKSDLTELRDEMHNGFREVKSLLENLRKGS